MWALLKLQTLIAKSAAMEMLVKPPESIRNQLTFLCFSSRF